MHEYMYFVQKRRYSAKETYNFFGPTNQSHPISVCCTKVSYEKVCMDICILYKIQHFYILECMHEYMKVDG